MTTKLSLCVYYNLYGLNKFVRDKHTSLFSGKTETKKKSLTKVIPVANVIKLFTAVSYDFS